MLPLAVLGLHGILPILGIVLLLAVLIFLHEGGHFVAAKALRIPVKQFALGFGPALWSRQRGETQYRINALPLGGYCAFADDQGSDPAPDLRAPVTENTGFAAEPESLDVEPGVYLRSRPLWQRLVVVSAGVLANGLVAWIAILIQMGVVGIPHQQPADAAHSGVVIASIIGDPARNAGLVEGDRVVAVNNLPVTSTQAFQQAIRSHAGKDVSLSVWRDDPAPPRKLVLRAHPGVDGKIGVALGDAEVLVFRRARDPVDLLANASHRTWEVTRMMAQGLWMLLSGQLPLEMIGGPIAIVHMGATTVKNFYQFCMFAAMISLDLAIINALPIPGLDGGHILIIGLEAITRRRLPRKVEESILQTGLVLLLGLGMLLIVKDIVTLRHHG